MSQYPPNWSPRDIGLWERMLAEMAIYKAAPALLAALEATQPLLMLAVHEAQKQKDKAFIERLQITITANRSAIAKAAE